MEEDLRVHVADCSGGGIYYYIVMVNGRPYDDFNSKKPLTWREQWDIAEEYKEALNG